MRTDPAAVGDTHVPGNDAEMTASGMGVGAVSMSLTSESCAVGGFAVLLARFSEVLNDFDKHCVPQRLVDMKPKYASYFDALSHYLSPSSPEVTQLTPYFPKFCQVRPNTSLFLVARCMIATRVICFLEL